MIWWPCRFDISRKALIAHRKMAPWAPFLFPNIVAHQTTVRGGSHNPSAETKKPSRRMAFCEFLKLINLSSISSRCIWCPGENSNLHILRYTDLNRARLPIPPPGQQQAVYHHLAALSSPRPKIFRFSRKFLDRSLARRFTRADGFFGGVVRNSDNCRSRLLVSHRPRQNFTDRG